MTEATARAADLLQVLNRLIEVLREETGLLRKMDPRAMQSLQHDKIVLIAAYESMLQRFREDPELLKDKDGALRQRIMAASTAFQNTLTENARALFAVKEANERLFKAIIKAVEEQRSDTGGYSSRGALAPSTAAGSGPAVSVALDARL